MRIRSHGSGALRGGAGDLDGVQTPISIIMLPHSPLVELETLASGQLETLSTMTAPSSTSVLGDGGDRSGQGLLDDIDTDLLLGVGDLDVVQRQARRP